MTTSKSPRRVLQVAYEAACQALPAHRHKFSPKKFTQPQLLACLVLKEFSRLDYRGLAEHLADHPDLGRLIGLKAVPHYTTFQKAAAAAPGGRPRPPDVRRRARAGAEGRGAEAAGPPGGHRRHGHGVAPRQPLLHEAAGRRERHAGDRTYAQLPEGRLRGRLRTAT